MGEREKDTSYPASLFPLRLKTRVWGHFFTQLNPNTNGVDHRETWQHGTRKSEVNFVTDAIDMHRFANGKLVYILSKLNTHTHI